MQQISITNEILTDQSVKCMTNWLLVLHLKCFFFIDVYIIQLCSLGWYLIAHELKIEMTE